MYLPISLNIKEKGDRCNWLRNVTGKKRDLELAIKEGSSMGGLYMSLCILKFAHRWAARE